MQPPRLLLSVSHFTETVAWPVEWGLCLVVADGTGAQSRDANGNDSPVAGALPCGGSSATCPVLRPALPTGFRLLPAPAEPPPLQTQCSEKEWGLESRLQQRQDGWGGDPMATGRVFRRRTF